MNALDLLFGPTGPALQYIFMIGYIPNQDEFLELTEEQYISYYKQCGETDEKIFMFSPKKLNLLNDDYNEISCLGEYAIKGFEKANEIINTYCSKSDKVLNTTEEKLRFVAAHLPDAFTKGTSYEKYHHLSID